MKLIKALIIIWLIYVGIGITYALTWACLTCFNSLLTSL